MRKAIAIALFLISLAISGNPQNITLQKPEFRSVYDVQMQCPQQVTWTIHRHDIGATKREPAWKFQNTFNDSSALANHQDYNHSGYDRGHMCPAADRSASRLAMKATFDMANIAPQLPALNRGAWKRSEAFCRSAALLYDSIEVVAIPIFLDRDTTFIGTHHLAVPHAFMKAAWLPANDSIIGIWFFFNH